MPKLSVVLGLDDHGHVGAENLHTSFLAAAAVRDMRHASFLLGPPVGSRQLGLKTRSAFWGLDFAKHCCCGSKGALVYNKDGQASCEGLDMFHVPKTEGKTCKCNGKVLYDQDGKELDVEKHIEEVESEDRNKVNEKLEEFRKFMKDLDPYLDKITKDSMESSGVDIHIQKSKAMEKVAKDIDILVAAKSHDELEVNPEDNPKFKCCCLSGKKENDCKMQITCGFGGGHVTQDEKPCEYEPGDGG